MTRRAGGRAASNLLATYTVLWVSEGALRKWLAPELSDELFFVRLPIGMMLIVVAALSVPLAYRRLWTLAIFLTAAATVFQTLHVWFGGLGATVAAYGIIMYLQPSVVGLLFASLAGPGGVHRCLKLILAAMVISLPIVALQVLSPPTATVNATLNDTTSALTTTFGIVRASGTFSSSTGYAIFLVVASVAFGHLTARRLLKRRTLVLCGASLLLSLALCGSRLAVFSVALVAVGLVAPMVVRRPVLALRLAGLGLATIVLGVVLVSQAFPLQFDAFRYRFALANQQEDTGNRVLSGVLSFRESWGEAGAAGAGLGSFARGAVGYTSPAWIESEPARIVAEAGPVFGMSLLVARYILLVAASMAALASLRRTTSAHAFAYVAALAPLLLSGQIVGQGTLNGATVLLLGLLGATLRAERPVDSVDVPLLHSERAEP